MQRKSWLLMSAEEIAIEVINNNSLFRKQKSYYTKKCNVTMIDRIEVAERIAKILLSRQGKA